MTITVTESGVSRLMKAADAFIHTLVKRGLEGDVLAGRLAGELLSEERARAIALEDTNRRTIEVAFVRSSANAVLETLKLAIKHDRYRSTVRFRLEPFIVEAAMVRMGDRKLTLVQQKLVWDSTRTPRKVQWPEWWQYCV